MTIMNRKWITAGTIVLFSVLLVACGAQPTPNTQSDTSSQSQSSVSQTAGNTQTNQSAKEVLEQIVAKNKDLTTVALVNKTEQESSANKGVVNTQTMDAVAGFLSGGRPSLRCKYVAVIERYCDSIGQTGNDCGILLNLPACIT